MPLPSSTVSSFVAISSDLNAASGDSRARSTIW
jgi:hypothetical protein